ncbi:alpha/beta hydrolase [Spiroplasma taiwanense]|uniref:Serine aminopeptidase S33 domain-containing protein n=1 Tax=Spiroplasma taiwanense CT-1 TaxID=1276220 RepID=S5LSY6_9MOLU|nr:alpha/beta fold hydrolase [Spiroplasma taiwanense]AGR40789.1 hypothetical protein STAIW_v1c00970 [Spiroplasma taiwanense CT-1]
MKRKNKKTFFAKINKGLIHFYNSLEFPFSPSRKIIRKQKANLKNNSNNYWVKDLLRTNQIMKKFYKRSELIVNNFEQIYAFTFKSRDGLNLSGFTYEVNPNSNKWVIACHWFSGHKNWALHHSIIFTKMGYNVMVFDFRGHGYSDNFSTTLGMKEENDLMGAVDWLKENRKIDSLALMGTSMGGFVVNFASLRYAKEFEKLNLKFIISDSTYVSVYSLILHTKNIYLKFLSKKRIKQIANKVIDKNNKYEDAFDFYDVNILKTIDKMKNPVFFPTLFFHSIDDKVTAVSDTYELIIKRKFQEDDHLIFNYCMHTQCMRIHFKIMNYKIAEFILKFNKDKTLFDKVVSDWELLVFDKKDINSIKLK